MSAVGLVGPAPDLVHHVLGGLRQERLVAELGAAWAFSFSAAARSLASRLRSAATSIVPDRSSATVAPATGRVAVAVKPRPPAEAQQLADGRLVARERRAVERQAGRDLLAGLEALVGAEAADLGDDC